jgi:cytoskeletal protein RodZ
METNFLSNAFSLGKALAGERKKKNIPLEKISKSTNISLNSLKALENEEFHKIPGEFYLKNYVKSYLKAIDCDEKVFFKTHKEAFRSVQPAAKEKKITYYSKLRYSRFKKKNVFFSGFVFFVLFVIVFFVLYLGKRHTSILPTHLPATALPLTPLTGADAFSIDYLPVRVHIEFLDNCWLRVQRGLKENQKKTIEQVYQKGDKLEIKGYALDFLIGNPAAVHFYLNSKEITIFKNKPGAERIAITPQNLNEILKK